MSEQMAEQISGETGSVGAEPAASSSSDVKHEAVAASGPEIGAVDSPGIAPDREAPKADAPEVEAPKIEASRPEASRPEASRPQASRPDQRMTGKLTIMSPGDRSSDEYGASPQAEAPSGKRRLSAVAAVVALATVAGAVGGALATSALTRTSGSAETSSNAVLEASVARIDADILALKASVEHTSRLGIAQFNKANDRLDKVEKAQAEPAARLARLSEAVDKLRAAPPVAPVPVAAAPVAAKEVTGSIAPPATATPATAPKVEVGRLPTVQGWVLRDVGNGGALIEGRQGIFEVYAGDPVPGLGRVDAIRRQDGRWVVVTSKGLVVAR
jgi:hypothetical protein